MAIPIRHANPENVAAAARTFSSRLPSSTNATYFNRTDQPRYLFACSTNIVRRENSELHEFVVMPDHSHVLLTIDAGMTLERAVQFVKGGFAFRAGKEFGMRSPVWQKGFSDARIWDGQSFERVREYIHNNPVKRGLVGEPSKYPYSSASGKFDLDPPPQGLKPVEISDLLRHG